MNLNPFELRKNDYYVKDLYQRECPNHSAIEPTRREEFRTRMEGTGAELFLEMGYSYLLMGINLDITWRVACLVGDYQGEVFYVGNDSENRIYFYHTGYGSCSGCDMYLGIEYGCEGTWEDTMSEMQKLQDDVKRSICCFDDVWEFLEWFLNEDRKMSDFSFSWNGVYDVVDLVADAYGLPVEKHVVLREREKKKDPWYRTTGFWEFNRGDGDGGYWLSEEMFGVSYRLDGKKLIAEMWPYADYGGGSYGYGYLLAGSGFGEWKQEKVLTNGNILVRQEYHGKIRYIELECDEDHTWDAFQNENRLGIRRIARRIAEKFNGVYEV